MAIDVEEYYSRYGPMVLRRCRRLLRDEQMALDAMQDTFVNLLQHRSRLQHSAPSSLLFRMATHVCLNRIRTSSRRPEDPDSELLQHLAAQEGPEPRLLSRLHLQRLLSGQRAGTGTIAVMHLLDGMTLEEVAREVGLSVSGVRKRLRQLRCQLRGMSDEPDEG